jgi:hypothetical protein
MKPASAKARPLILLASRRQTREAFIYWPLGFAMAIWPVIFLPRSAKTWDETVRRAVLAHERVHHRQQRMLGLPQFALAYYFNRRARWRIERAGYRREFAIYRKHGRRPIAAGYARTLSGPFYGWMVSYKEALAWCEHALRGFDRA